MYNSYSYNIKITIRATVSFKLWLSYYFIFINQDIRLLFRNILLMKSSHHYYKASLLIQFQHILNAMIHTGNLYKHPFHLELPGLDE